MRTTRLASARADDSIGRAAVLESVREGDFDRCVTELKLRDARERIRERKERCEVRRALGEAGEKGPLDRTPELRSADAHRGRPGPR